MSDTEIPLARKNQKSPDAFRTISEVAEELDVPQHVLRFWETKFTVVKPLKRGGGRRYYRPADVELIRGIRDLLYTHGFTIKGAQKLLKEQGGKIENIEALAPKKAAQATPLAAEPLENAPSFTPEDEPDPEADSARSSDKFEEGLRNALKDLKELRALLEG
ncbi:MAG: MerR family transcriptional regulator [Sneathiellales bacterium]|nr:MerR family transcriptional regulator [Sneathiellales bacterium]